MKFIKINNLVNIFGQADYKGLNIDLFVAGSQIYKQDLSYCIIATNEDTLPTNVDLVELTQDEYTTEKNSIENELAQNQQAIDQQIIGLRSQNAQMLLALVNGGLM